MKKLNRFYLILLAILTATNFCVAQSADRSKKITSYLESSIGYSNKLIVSKESQSVFAADIFESNLDFNTGGRSTLYMCKQYFLKNGKKLTAFASENDLLASPEFIKCIKSKKFKLVTEDDGVAFQTVLKMLDNERGLGFFKEANTWYFIRSKFFSDVKAYVVSTSKKGEITAVTYEYKLKKELPEKLLRPRDVVKSTSAKKPAISKQDSAFMHKYLRNKVNYAFEVSPLDFYSLNKISTISLNKCDLKVIQGTKGNSSTTVNSFMLVSDGEKYIKQPDVNNLLEMPLFLSSLQGKYKIETKEDARLFQYVLDDLAPIKRSDIALKTFYKKENIWIFVREKSFDDLKGYMVVVNDENKVVYMDYTTISEKNIIRLKMKDPNFKVDYKFKLENPTANKITLKRGEGLSVKISFDENMVNAKGLWIYSRLDGHRYGMYAGTTINSPYSDGFTGMALENSHHTIEYFLLENGVRDVSKAIDSIKIDVTIK